MIRCLTLLLFISAATSFSKVKVVNLSAFRQITQQPTDTLFVVNFWATWCKPCVAEMPYFENASHLSATLPVKVIFVSLNYPREENTVNNFLSEKQITTPCLLLNAGNPNHWIDSIATEWGGSIPATIMYRQGRPVFFREGEFSETELDSIIKTKII